jgi:hypothetical protein
VAQIQEIWRKLNANERLVGWGAIVVLISWLVGLVSGGGGWSVLAAIVVLVIYYLKYTPSQSITWPAPIPTIVLVVSGISALFAILAVLSLLSLFGAFGSLFGGFFIGYLVAGIGNAVGAAMMALGAWREYQAMPKASAPPPPPAPPAA